MGISLLPLSTPHRTDDRCYCIKDRGYAHEGGAIDIDHLRLSFVLAYVPFMFFFSACRKGSESDGRKDRSDTGFLPHSGLW